MHEPRPAPSHCHTRRQPHHPRRFIVNSEQMSHITLIGFGITGQFLLSYILDILPADKISIIDPDFLGGDLARHYGGIRSNTTIENKVGALEKLPPVWSETISSLKARGDPSDTVLLADLVTDLRKTSVKLSSSCHAIYDRVEKAVWSIELKQWSLYLKSGAKHLTQIVCFCGGMNPRQEDYGIPIIPLSIALDQERLKRLIRVGQQVVVVGSAHSATLILKNLNNISDIKFTCMYRGSKPFKFARDGQYSGIKQESADIADAIEKGLYTNLTMVPISNIQGVSKAIRKTDWIIQAFGFDPVFPVIMNGDTVIIPTWDPSTGLSDELQRAQAFGACVPNTTTINDTKYVDISLGSFVDQMSIRWPLLKSLIQA